MNYTYILWFFAFFELISAQFRGISFVKKQVFFQRNQRRNGKNRGKKGGKFQRKRKKASGTALQVQLSGGEGREQRTVRQP